MNLLFISIVSIVSNHNIANAAARIHASLSAAVKMVLDWSDGLRQNILYANSERIFDVLVAKDTLSGRGSVQCSRQVSWPSNGTCLDESSSILAATSCSLRCQRPLKLTSSNLLIVFKSTSTGVFDVV